MRAAAILVAALVAGCAATPTAEAPRTAPAPVAATTPGAAAAPTPQAAAGRRAIVAPDHVTLADQDAIIELERGARVHVRLQSEKLLIAKRRWHVTAVEGAALAPYGNPWFTARHAFEARELGNWIFDFNAVAPGTTTVTFDFRRDDEPLSAAPQTAKFDFVVR